MKKKIILAAALMVAHTYTAQLGDENLLPNITPPSPEAYSLGSFGGLEVGEFTGSPNISIPLLHFKGAIWEQTCPYLIPRVG
ncbi:hypothetical protein [Chryseobacterium pennipullorum]|uniref:Uncharacterized protein n=1 Tax=Chryseobacterium pennipullorum TaxID=2258963 RepID=A0A3D9B1D5_9FLAO|nr:hypothetical protein [Chryseobacterium pennipullorum]REC47414.1 hypothetical protein DRF67_10215 [Chryseobacterium pennipullorum]